MSFILKYETSFVWWLLYDDAILVVDIKRMDVSLLFKRGIKKLSKRDCNLTEELRR